MNMKTGDDFTLVNSELTVTTDMVDGAEMTVFQFGVEGGISIALVSSSSTCNVGDNVLLTATVMEHNTPVEAAEVTFKLGETVLGTDETDANGVATYTYATSSAGSLSFSASYQTSTSNSVSVTVNHSYSLSFSQATYTASGGSATLECTLLEDNVALSGASVTVTGSDGSVYNGITNTNGLASITVSVSGETTFTCTYQNVTDTCIVTISRVIYQPALDGTESITTIRTYTPTISNNELVSGCGYLTNGWDNTIDWELTFEYYVTGDNNGYLVIPKGTTSRDYNGVQQWYTRQLNFRVQGGSPSGNLSNAGLSTNTWISVKVTKEGYVWKVYYNDTLKTTWNASSYASTLDTWTEMCIGLDRDNNRNSAKIRNIKVETL